MVDYKASMTAHDSISLVDRSGMPTFVCKSAVDLEITIASTDGKNYRALAVTFQQLGSSVPADKKDPSGHINFERLTQADSKISFRNKALCSVVAGDYEFFVLIQDVPTGNIGLIDPGVEVKDGEV